MAGLIEQSPHGAQPRSQSRHRSLIMSDIVQPPERLDGCLHSAASAIYLHKCTKRT